MAKVAPLVGAWIEILIERVYNIEATVAPLVGAWIEIIKKRNTNKAFLVAPLVGAWIEICTYNSASGCFKSLLSWERGLKYLSTSKS